MRYGWRAWSLFGTGTLFGLLAGAALYAPPEMADQPPPWDHWARDKGQATAATQAVAATPAPAASAAPAPMAAASDAAAVVQSPLANPAETSTTLAAAAPPAVPPVASSTEPPAKVATAIRTAAPKKRKVESEEPAVDTSVAGAGPATSLVTRVEPEAVQAPSEAAPPRAESSEGADDAR
jgi:hypothetical protein